MEQAAKKPNIVFILSDDQGAWALGCAGNAEIRTPNLDRLAREGTRYENFFCVSPVCSPARASIFTGKIPSQHGVHDWLRDDNAVQARIEYLDGQISFPEILAENGYRCGLSGKWHLGNNGVPKPGFDFWYAHKSGGGSYYGAPVYKNGALVREDRYITEAITDEALAFLDSCDGDMPFFLNVGYTAPHSPWLDNHPEEYTSLYRDCPFESLPNGERHPHRIYLTDEVGKDLRGNRIGYYAAVTAMDAGIGRILAKLEEKKIRQDTLVVFMGDNGFSCGHHGFWGKGNGTFPLNMYDTSVKVPCIFSQPGSVAQNTVADALLSAYDFMPTLLDYALGSLSSFPQNLPGRSFALTLKDGSPVPGGEVFVMDEYGPNRMIRTRDSKYVRRYPYGPDELYDLSRDPDERENLIEAPEYREVLKQLRARLDSWFAEYADPRLDAAKESVWGSGQINRAGVFSAGENTYVCDDYIKQTPFYRGIRGKSRSGGNGGKYDG